MPSLKVDVGAIQIFLDDASVGITKPKIALARFGNSDVRVYAKSIPPLQVAAELFGALLARAAGFQSPRPGIAIDPQTNQWWYTSRQKASPDLSRRFSVPALPGPAQQQALLNAFSWLSTRPRFPALVAWDEWVNNRDRNIQNLLVDGDDFLLIDHEQAFDCHRHDRPDVNKMADLVNGALGLAAQLTIKRGAITGAMTFSASWAQDVHDMLSPLPDAALENVGNIRAWTEDRYPSTAQRVERRLLAGQSNLI